MVCNFIVIFLMGARQLGRRPFLSHILVSLVGVVWCYMRKTDFAHQTGVFGRLPV